MPTPVKMPRLGESVAEGTVGAWLKNEGDWVEKDESLAEIITDKINAELPSPVAGRLAKILVQVDQTVAVGADIALIEENADVSASPPAQAAPGPDAAPVKSPAQAETPVIENEEASMGAGNGATATARASHAETEERQRISPLARRLAREHDVDLNVIAGTGTGGRVRKEDILAYVQQRQASVAAPRPTTTVAPPTAPEPQPAFTAPAVEFTPATTAVEGDVEIVTPSRMRLAITEHMVRSKRTSPEEQGGVQTARGLQHQLPAIRNESSMRRHSQIPNDQLELDGRQQDHHKEAHQPWYSGSHRCRADSAHRL